MFEHFVDTRCYRIKAVSEGMDWRFLLREYHYKTPVKVVNYQKRPKITQAVTRSLVLLSVNDFCFKA